MIKAIYKNPTANIILNGERMNIYFLRSGHDNNGCFFQFIQNSIVAILATAKKRTKRHPNCKRRMKLFLFGDDMTLYVENDKDFPENY